MPQVRLPIPRNRLWTFGLTLLGTATIAGLFAALRRRQFPLEETTGSPLVAALADGRMLRGAFRAVSLGPDNRIRWTGIGTRHGAGEENWEFSHLSLRPDGAVFAVSTIETFRGGFDMRVTVHDSWTGAALFSATDNLHPPTVWRGDETDIPALLLEQQAMYDADWREWQQVDPDVARPIAQARFADPASDGELFFDGWTAAGHTLMAGRSRLEIRTDRLSVVTQREPWWGVAGPAAGGQWGWIERGHGAPPAIHAGVPQPPLARQVTLVDGQLLVDDVVQTDSALSGGVLAVDGPFA